jgi:hypothetical protein
MDVVVTRPFGLGLGLLLLMTGVVVSPAGGDSMPVTVTTDTPEYCHKLLDRISEAVHAAVAPPPVEVSSLSTEGKRMCNNGLTRGGILRLRRALLILEQGTAAP